MIDEKKLLITLEEWKKESKETVGLKAPALLEKVMEEVRQQAINEEIKARIEREDANDNRWIPVSEMLPKGGDYVLISFDNCSVSDIGRYETDEEGGAFYPGDDEKSYVEHGLIVNAWMPLPELYRGETE